MPWCYMTVTNILLNDCFYKVQKLKVNDFYFLTVKWFYIYSEFKVIIIIVIIF